MVRPVSNWAESFPKSAPWRILQDLEWFGLMKFLTCDRLLVLHVHVNTHTHIVHCTHGTYGVLHCLLFCDQTRPNLRISLVGYIVPLNFLAGYYCSIVASTQQPTVYAFTHTHKYICLIYLAKHMFLTKSFPRSFSAWQKEWVEHGTDKQKQNNVFNPFGTVDCYGRSVRDGLVDVYSRIPTSTQVTCKAA